MADQKIAIPATEEQWAHCVGLMTFAAMKISEDCESDNEKQAAVARSLAPALNNCRELVSRISDAIPKIVMR